MKIILVLCITIIVLTALLLQSKHGYLSNKAKILKIKDLLRSSEQWSRACKEDKDAITALLHANSSAAYLASARKLMPDREIDDLSLCSTAVEEYARYVESLQQKYLKIVAKQINGASKG
jgi:hypothetical protein